MAGLDTRGAFDGFVQGFGLVDGYLNRQASQKRADQQVVMQERGLQMREQEFAAQQEQHQRQQDQQQIAQFYSGWASGVEAPISEDLAGAFTRNPMADPRHLFNPKTEQAVQYADKLAKGEGSLFSQQTADAMNDFYGPRVSRGQGGKKRLAGIYPGQREGTFAFELEVEDEQGNKRLAPMTVNRGLDGEDDEVAQYDIEQAIGPVMGAKSIYQALGQNRERMTAYLQATGYLPKTEKWEEVQGPDGSILQRNMATGEMKSVLGRRKAAGAGSEGGVTAQQKNFYFLRDVMGYPEDKAYQASFGGTGAVNGSIPDGVRLGLNLLDSDIKKLDGQLAGKAGLMLSDEDQTALKAQREALVVRRNTLAEQSGVAGFAAAATPPEQQVTPAPGQPAQQPQPAQSAAQAQPAASKQPAAPSAKVATLREVEQTARKYGMTNEQVIQRLQAQGVSVRD